MAAFIGSGVGTALVSFEGVPGLGLGTLSGHAGFDAKSKALVKGRGFLSGYGHFIVVTQAGVTVTQHTAEMSERYTSLVVKDSDAPKYCIFYIEMPRPVLGEIWVVSSEIHGTNDDLRARGYGLHLTTEIRVDDNTSNTRGGLEIARANGSFNIGPEAHHGLIPRPNMMEWTQADIDYVSGWGAVYLKFFAWAGSTQAQSGDRCDITSGRGHLKCLRIVP